MDEVWDTKTNKDGKVIAGETIFKDWLSSRLDHASCIAGIASVKVNGEIVFNHEKVFVYKDEEERVL